MCTVSKTVHDTLDRREAHGRTGLETQEEAKEEEEGGVEEEVKSGTHAAMPRHCGA